MGKEDQIECPLCEKGVLEEVVTDYQTSIRQGDHYKKVTLKNITVERCTFCHEIMLPKDSLEKVESEKHEIRGLLTPEELKKLRKKLRLTQTGMADLLGVGKKSYLRWENGSYQQNVSTDRYIRLIDAIPENVAFLKKLAGMK
jgi:putative zinc finger/helix-turn-helix YgiT family protein